MGGGPAGAALAIRLRRLGHEVVVFERLGRPRWRACGVYSSPLTRRRLADLGLSAQELARLIRPISAMVVETVAGSAAARLEYPAPHHACGVDRVRLEEVLLARARDAGARIEQGAVVRSVELHGSQAKLHVSTAEGAASWAAGLVVGADGPASLVARSARVAIPSRRFRRAGLTVHRHDPQAEPEGLPMDARMVVGPGWYCGIAPVPNGRVNVGIVVGEAELRRQLTPTAGLDTFLDRKVATLPGGKRAWHAAPATDELQVALPLVHRVKQASGPGFLLVGDAAGFIDPLSGEGLHRALVSAELAADAISSWRQGDRSSMRDYDHHLRSRFRNKDVLSWLFQAFLTNSQMASLALSSLARRHDLRQTFSLAMADLVPASRVLDPRFLAALLVH